MLARVFVFRQGNYDWPSAMTAPILEVRDLKTHFPMRKGLLQKGPSGIVRAVDGVSLTLEPGDVLGLVGESGCGKSTLARSILQLVPPTSGAVIFEGKNLTHMNARELREVRPHAQIIFQDPYASLNPRMTVYATLAEPMLAHGKATRKELPKRVAELMETVGLAPRFMRKYPHEFSGGQRQRIAVARTLALKPRLIIADEPVSALDVSVQAQILNLIADLCKREHLTMIFISHDLAVVRHIAKRIAVMYLGKIVEIADADRIFEHPAHPYTQALMSAVPLPDPAAEDHRRRIILPGDPPSPLNPPSGCPFHPRCPVAESRCKTWEPIFFNAAPEHLAACIKLEPERQRHE